MEFHKEVQIDNIRVIKLIGILFITAIILLPVDNLPYFSGVLGELGAKAAVYPFIVIVAIIGLYTIKNKSLCFNDTNEEKLLIAFLCWIIFSVILNLNNIINSNFKDRSGINKVILQLMVVLFLVLISYSTSIIIKLKNIKINDLKRYAMYSLIPVFIYGTIELVNLLGIYDLSEVIKFLSSIFQTYYRGELYPKGIRTITGEVSYLGMYASFVMPWIVSYIFTGKSKMQKTLGGVGTAYLILLLVLSKSRAAYAILFVEIFLFTVLILVMKVNKNIKKIISIGVISLILIFILLNNTILNKIGGDINSVNNISISGLIQSLKDPNNMSNVARLGMQEAALSMGKDNPIVGVGIGQYGFYVEDYLSERALESNEVQRWISEDEEAWPPAFSLYPRIFGEQGLIGICLWITFLGYMGIKLILNLYKSENDIDGIALCVSFAGVLISWFNADTYAQIPFWILIPFIISYNNKNNKLMITEGNK